MPEVDVSGDIGGSAGVWLWGFGNLVGWKPVADCGQHVETPVLQAANNVELLSINEVMAIAGQIGRSNG